MDPSGRSERINSAGARHFGHQAIVFEPKAGGQATVRGIFRRSSSVVDPDTGVAVQSTTPVLIVEDLVLPGGVPPLEGDAFTVEGQKYVVVQMDVEGEGTSRCYLRKS
jgi:hypothetical protein